MRARLIPLVSVLLLGLAACGQSDQVDPDGSPTPTATTPSPTGSPDDPDGEGLEEITAFFIRFDDSGAWVEPEVHTLEEPTVAVATAAIALAVEGSPHNPDLMTAAPEGTRVLDVRLEDGLLIVDLSEEVRGGSAGSSLEGAFAQQLAHTGAQFDTVEAVQLQIEGEPVEELWGHIIWDGPIEPDTFALTPITFEFPTWGQEVEPGPVTAGGQANTFEATVELRLRDPDGAVVEDTFTTATSGTGTRGEWEHTFETPADRPGTWTVEAIEPDPSGGEGRPPLVTRVQIRVTA